MAPPGLTGGAKLFDSEGCPEGIGAGVADALNDGADELTGGGVAPCGPEDGGENEGPEMDGGVKLFGSEGCPEGIGAGAVGALNCGGGGGEVLKKRGEVKTITFSIFFFFTAYSL